MGHLDAITETSGAYPRGFGKYLLLAPLGQGGMGEVHLAKHAGLAGIERYCVVKTLRTSHQASAEHLTRFLDEARTAVRLSHKNICSVSEVGEHDGTMFLAMDYIAGRDLATVRRLLARNGRAMSVPIALFIAGELLEALDYAHRLTDPATGLPLGIVHRDVSPQNVMISFEGEVKLIDFGLAASRMRTENTDAGHVVGKLAYMSTEHAQGASVDGAADQFAVAVMIYELVTGSRFYDGLTQRQVWEIAGRGGHVPKHWADLDEKLAIIVGRALRPAASERHSSCAAMRRELEDYQRTHAGFVGSDALRSLLSDLFPDAREQQRRMFASFGSPSSRRDPREVLTKEVSSAPRVRLWDMPVSSEATPLDHDDDGLDRSSLDPSEMTEDLTARTPPPLESSPTDAVPVHGESVEARHDTRWRAGGALAVAAAVSLCAGAVWWFSSAPSPTQPATQALTEAPSRPIVATAASPPPRHASTVKQEQTPERVEPPPDGAAAAEEEVATSAAKEQRPSPRRAPKRRATKQVTATPSEPSLPPRPDGKLERLGDKLRFLRERCASRVSCAPIVLDQAQRLKDLDISEVRAFNERLDGCVASCQR